MAAVTTQISVLGQLNLDFVVPNHLSKGGKELWVYLFYVRIICYVHKVGFSSLIKGQKALKLDATTYIQRPTHCSPSGI